VCEGRLAGAMDGSGELNKSLPPLPLPAPAEPPPDSLGADGLPLADAPAASGAETAPGMAAGASPPNQALDVYAPVQMPLKVRDQQGRDVELMVNRTKPLRVVMIAACTRAKIDQSRAYFIFNGRLVVPEDTPERLGMGPGAVLGMGQREVKKPTAKPALVAMDLEWRCPSCRNICSTATSLIVQDPRVRCIRCGWIGCTDVWKRSDKDHVAAIEKKEKEAARHTFEKQELGHIRKEFERPKSSGSGSTLRSSRTWTSTERKVATSGIEIEVDYEGQHIEAPLGGLLALVTQVQRERLAGGLLKYLLFCLSFIIITTMARPVHKIFEVQNSIYSELILEAFPTANADFKSTILDISNWGDFWAWVDGVLLEKVYSEHYWLDSTGKGVQRAPYSRLTVGKYNRVINALQFRQVRVKPTLPKCPRDERGLKLDAFQLACTEEQSDTTYSCDTPLENHELSRPCWGVWNAGEQEVEYPDAFQKETAERALNSLELHRHLLCPQNCEAYFVHGHRTAERYFPFSLPGLADWVTDFDIEFTPGQGLAKCKAACDVSGSAMTGKLSTFAGAGGAPNFCGDSAGKPTESIEYRTSELKGDCWSDVVLLPLNGTEAKRRAAAMWRERWTSESTRGLVVEVNTYNPNYDIATATRVSIEANPGGHLHTSVEQWSLRLDVYSSTVDKLRFVLEICFLVWLAYYLAIEASEMYKERWEYFLDVWNYIEVANLTIYIYTTVAWIVMCQKNDLGRFKVRKPDEFLDLYTTAKEFNMGPTIASFNLIYGFIRFFKYFRLHLRFRVLWDTVSLAMQRVAPLMALYVFIAFAFTWAGHWLFGQQSRHFHSISEAFLYIVQSTIVGIDYVDIKEASPAMAPWWYIAWYVTSTVFLVSLVIAATLEAFQRVMYRTRLQERAQQDAIDRGARIPTFRGQLIMYLRASRGKADREVLDNQNELMETLREVDLEKLWKRLMEGVLEKEAAIDAAEMRFLFDDNQRKARHFINRICNLATLARVEVPDAPPRTVLQEIEEVESAIDGLDSEITGVRSDLKGAFKPLQYRDRSTDGKAAEPPRMTKAGSKLASVFDGAVHGGFYAMEEALYADASKTYETGFGRWESTVVDEKEMEAVKPNIQMPSSFAGTPGLKRPNRGQLQTASALLNMKRKYDNFAAVPGQVEMPVELAASEVQHRPPIGKFTTADLLQRDV